MKFIVHKAATRGYFDHGWLKTYHTFSFADYYNPERVHFGALRVLNDDTVAPKKGFGMHPHHNMEVVSIPLQGFLRHGDSVKNESTITPGEIQVMSTGAGIYHSEYNASETEELQFLQIWIIPNIKETKPEYHNYDSKQRIKYLMNKKNTGVYIFVLEGDVKINGQILSRRDGIGIWEVENVSIECLSESHILAIEVSML